MAGTLAVIPVRDESKRSAAIREQWEVQFSRFFSYPTPTASKCPDLVPLQRYLRNRGSLGTWLAASAPALLRLADKASGAGTVLDVSLKGALLEEHYVSKLHFSWPQVKCISGFPARGARAVIVSYKDIAGEIQKFAVRFWTTSDAEAFINALKGILKGESDVKPFGSGSVIPLETGLMSYGRASEVLRVVNDHVTDYTPELPASSIFVAKQPSFPREPEPLTKFESNFAALPPSFTSLLTDYCPIAEQVQAAYQTIPEEVHLKSQIAKYMEDASFHDMLIKVERVVNEMGGGEYAM